MNASLICTLFGHIYVVLTITEVSGKDSLDGVYEMCSLLVQKVLGNRLIDLLYKLQQIIMISCQIKHFYDIYHII